MLKFLYQWYNRDKMLSDNLVQLPPVEEYSLIQEDCIFIGAKIRNLYDEQRLCIQSNLNPTRHRVQGVAFNLYGIKQSIAPEYQTLVNDLKQQKTYDLIGYSTLLQDHNLTCNDCYFNLKPPLYPIDNHHIRKCLPDFNYEEFICFNPEASKFQAFTSLNLFFITVV